MRLHLSDNRQPITTSRNTTDLFTRHAGQGNHFTIKKPLGISNCVGHKKDCSTQFCVDYTKDNAVACKDAYPIPSRDDTLDTLSGLTWFSTIGLKSSYWQVEMAPADSKKTALCTQEGLFEFN